MQSDSTRYTKLRRQNPLPHRHLNMLPQDTNALSSSKCKAIQHATPKLSTKKCTPSPPPQRLKCTLEQVRNNLSVSTVFPAEFRTTSRDSLQLHKVRITHSQTSKRLNRAYIIEHTKWIPSAPLPHAPTRYEKNLEAKIRSDSTRYNKKFEHTKCTCSPPLCEHAS